MINLLFVLSTFLFQLTKVKGSDMEIVGQLQERLLATNSTENLLARDYLEEKFPFLRSECVNDALKPFLPTCLERGIESVDTALRVETAVRLSICEFRASGLEHIPNGCESKDFESMMDCMIHLESSAQWWTTYSGNYQRLSTICFEYSLPYEKQQILALFFNITTMYNDINDNLSTKFYDVLFKSETVSKKYFENLAALFNNHMGEFANQAEFHQSDVEDSFKAHMDNINDLMRKGSEDLERGLIIKDEMLIKNIDQILNMIKMISTELSETNVEDQINLVKQRALESWKNMEDVVANMHKTQFEGQNLMGQEWEQFMTSTKKNISMMSVELTKSQNQAFEMLDNYNDALKNSVLPTISEEVLPQMHALQNQLLLDWKQTTYYISEELTHWNNEVFDSFEAIARRLNCTMEQVVELDQRMSRIRDLFGRISTIIEIALNFVHCNFAVLRYFFASKVFWTLAFITPFLLRIFKTLPRRLLGFRLISYMLPAFKWATLLVTIFMGSRFGALIVSNANQN